MPVSYKKPYLAISDQLALLQRRGMIVTDVAKATSYLERIGYYRLSGYWYPFRQSETAGTKTTILDDFRLGTSFAHVVELYVFDKKLRLLFLDAIERVEVALRVDIALLLGKRSVWAHRESHQLDGKFARQVNWRGQSAHEDWLGRLDREAERSREDFVKHFEAKYADPLPVWMAIELWDFGLLSRFMGGMKHSDLNLLAAKYGYPRRELLTTTVRGINHVRNICAHHARLWNRSPSDQLKPARPGEVPLLDHIARDSRAQSRLYALAAALQLLMRTINPSSRWAERLKAHIATFPSKNGIAIGQSGFPQDWASLPLWSAHDRPG